MPPARDIRSFPSWKCRRLLLMQSEGTVVGCYVGDGVLVDEDVPLDFQKDREVVERFYISFHFIAVHELDYDFDPLFARLVQVLVLNVEWCLCHVPLLGQEIQSHIYKY